MKVFKFEVTLVSGIIHYSSDPDKLFSDPRESFEYNFYNYGGTEIPYDAIPCLKPGEGTLPEENSFVGLWWDDDSETLEGSSANFMIHSVSGDQNTGWDYTYELLINFIAEASGTNADEAMEKIRKEVLDNLAIYDGGIEEIIDIENVKVVELGK